MARATLSPYFTRLCPPLYPEEESSTLGTMHTLDIVRFTTDYPMIRLGSIAVSFYFFISIFVLIGLLDIYIILYIVSII